MHQRIRVGSGIAVALFAALFFVMAIDAAVWVSASYNSRAEVLDFEWSESCGEHRCTYTPYADVAYQHAGRPYIATLYLNNHAITNSGYEPRDSTMDGKTVSIVVNGLMPSRIVESEPSIRIFFAFFPFGGIFVGLMGLRLANLMESDEDGTSRRSRKRRDRP